MHPRRRVPLRSARKSLQFTGMRGSTAERVAKHVAGLEDRSFVAVSDLEGPRSAVESSVSRLAAAGEIERIRKGLYWKGPATPFGMAPPRVEEVAIALGGPGSGPAGVSAAAWLGLTSQVPATYLAAVPSRVPTPWRRMRFTQRPVERLLRALTPTEVAVLEVLRAGPEVAEAGWDKLAERLIALDAAGTVRLTVLDAAVTEEPHREARAQWAALRQTHPELIDAA